MNGLLNINKPKGFTSQDVVSKVRKILAFRHIGHMGTLDPQGEGVLVLGVGSGARLFDYMLAKDKVYEAEFDFGYETDTLDGDGQVVATTDNIPSIYDIIAAMKSQVGFIDQLPPKYSAKNINGKRAYDLAREGVEFELKTSLIQIYSFDLLEKAGENKYLFRIHCSGGTYIRSICRDLAYSLDTYATMTSIKRIKCGDFRVENSVTLEELEEKGISCLIPLDVALEKLDRVDVPDSFYKQLSNGVAYPYEGSIVRDFTVYCKDELFGIGKLENGCIKVKTYLRG